jgi:hypothetical protein
MTASETKRPTDPAWLVHQRFTAASLQGTIVQRQAARRQSGIGP